MTSGGDRLAASLVEFCRALRAAGIPLGTAEVLDALRSVRQTGLARRDDVRIALRSSLVRSPEQFAAFDRAFGLWFGHPDRRLELDVVAAASGDNDTLPPVPAAAITASAATAGCDVSPRVARGGDYSPVERLADKDFDAMTAAELEEAAKLLTARLEALPEIASRRYRPDLRGDDVDLRRSLQRMAQHNAELLRLLRRRRRNRPPPLVLICDISGSMSRYSRMFLHLAHVLGRRTQPTHCFVFGTRLSNVTRRLVGRDADAALAQVAADVADWDGGTRIAASLRHFNRDWGRRVLGQNASVLLMTDGLERDAQSDLEYQAARLHRSCRRLIWLNPMLRYEHFEPKAFGMRAILPHVDRLLAAHNVSSLARIASALAADDGPSARAFRR